MKKQEKVRYLADNHSEEFNKTYREANEVVSSQHPMWCVCRQLCTGLHEMNCRRFKEKVYTETIKRMKHLLPDKKTSAIIKRLDYLRTEIEAERISYGEIAELRSLVEHIDKGDVLLLEWAGVPENK